MKLKRRKASIAVAAFLLFSILQIGLHSGFAEPNSTKAETLIVQQIVARLVTRNNQPITLNGQSAGTGASILSGATLETSADQSATVNVGPLGSVDISPNTKVIVTFEQGILKAHVIYGCVIVTARKTLPEKSRLTRAPQVKRIRQQAVCSRCVFNRAQPLRLLVQVSRLMPARTQVRPAAQQRQAVGGLFGLGVPATIAIITRRNRSRIHAVVF